MLKDNSFAPSYDSMVSYLFLFRIIWCHTEVRHGLIKYQNMESIPWYSIQCRLF